MNQKPAIVAPVMRSIGVADAARSTVFYRDVLGFEIREQAGVIEALNGPARIRFGTHDYAPDNWEKPRPRGSAMLFFETDDAAAMHAAIRARGGNPSEMEKVNWIKMRMFEVRDPDGHTLCSGNPTRSRTRLYRNPCCGRSCRRCRSTTCPRASRTTAMCSDSR